MYWDRYLEINKNLSKFDFGYIFAAIIVGIVIISYIIAKIRPVGSQSTRPGESILLALMLITLSIIVLMVIGVVTNSVSVSAAFYITLVFFIPTAALMISQKTRKKK